MVNQAKLLLTSQMPSNDLSKLTVESDSAVVTIKLYDLNELINQVKMLNAKIDIMDQRLNILTNTKTYNNGLSDNISNPSSIAKASQCANHNKSRIKKKSTPVISKLANNDEIVINSSPESSILRKVKSSSDKFSVQANKVTSQYDLNTLNANIWLNDNIINSYFSLLQKNDSIIIDSLQINNFIDGNHDKIKKWYQKSLFRSADLNSIKYIIFPIYQNNHWTLVSINTVEKTFVYYNSLAIAKTYDPKLVFINCLISGINALFPSIKIYDYQRYFPIDIPQQNNNVDCGVFICLYLRYLFYYDKFTFDQSMIEAFRLLIKSELIDNKLKCIHHIDKSAKKL
jgi:Ulp1 family protease